MDIFFPENVYSEKKFYFTKRNYKYIFATKLNSMNFVINFEKLNIN